MTASEVSSDRHQRRQESDTNHRLVPSLILVDDTTRDLVYRMQANYNSASSLHRQEEKEASNADNIANKIIASKRKFNDAYDENDQDSSDDSSSTQAEDHCNSRQLWSRQKRSTRDIDIHIGKQIVSQPSLATAESSKSTLAGGRKKGLDEVTARMEKNQREKMRSSIIANQIKEIHEILFQAGIKCPRGTKGMILAEAAAYIRTLQNRNQQQQHCVHQPQRPQNATSRNFHESINSSIDGSYDSLHNEITHMTSGTSTSCSKNDFYKQVFYSCGVGIGICTMGGSLLDCNDVFSNWFGYPKETITSKTIFDCIDPDDLHRAFQAISQLVSLVMTSLNDNQTTITPSNEKVRKKSVTVRAKNKTHQEKNRNIRVSLVVSTLMDRDETDASNTVVLPHYFALSLVPDHMVDEVDS